MGTSPTSSHVYVYVPTFKHMHMHMYMCMAFACAMHVHAWSSSSNQLCASSRSRSPGSTYMHVYMHACMHTARGRDRQAAPLCMYTCMRTYIHVYSSRSRSPGSTYYTYMHSYACMHTRMGTQQGGEIAWRSHGDRMASPSAGGAARSGRDSPATVGDAGCNRRRCRLQP